MQNNLLKGKTAVITGCNRGIGKSILQKFSEHGANSIACVRETNNEFEKFCKNLENKNKIKIIIISFDLSKKDQLSEGINKIINLKKRIDILVNNAGILFNSIFQMTSEKKLKEIFDVNFFSHITLTQKMSREMMNKSGSIIFVSSTSAKRNDIGRFAYSATKAAISSTSRVLAKELGIYKIRVNSICPGLTKTDMSEKNTREDFKNEELNKISLKRLAEPDEIANVAVFLASELSSYITGQDIVVDGGV